MMTTNKLGLYIHIPFCVRKCKYCDFLSFPCAETKILHEYIRALMREIKIKSRDWHFREVDTVYIGGGTPSLVSSDDISMLMDCIRDNFYVSDDAEITIEANPATVSDEKLEMYLDKGINRLSLGVQSFENTVLETLGRIHNKNDAFNSFQKAKKAGFRNINLDIMFGIPGQNLKMWKDTVRQCIFLNPAHISMYSLQIEEGTEFYDMYRRGELETVSDQADREMYHEALRMMRTAGYEHYEISNCALHGYKSRHNIKYWSYEEYAGIGLGASSFIDGSRYKNCSRMQDYIKAIKANVAPVDAGSVQAYGKRDEMGIYIFTGLRKSEGLSIDHFQKTFDEYFFCVYNKNILDRYKGYLVYDDGRLYLTEKGMDISNRIMAEFI